MHVCDIEVGNNFNDCHNNEILLISFGASGTIPCVQKDVFPPLRGDNALRCSSAFYGKTLSAIRQLVIRKAEM